MPVNYKVSSKGTLLLLVFSVIISDNNHCRAGFVLWEYLNTAFVIHSSSLTQKIHFLVQKRADGYIWPDRVLQETSGTKMFKHEKQWYSPDLTTGFPPFLGKKESLKRGLGGSYWADWESFQGSSQIWWEAWEKLIDVKLSDILTSLGKLKWYLTC